VVEVGCAVVVEVGCAAVVEIGCAVVVEVGCAAVVVEVGCAVLKAGGEDGPAAAAQHLGGTGCATKGCACAPPAAVDTTAWVACMRLQVRELGGR